MGTVNAAVALAGGALVSWVLRVLFIAVLPADRLPARWHRRLRHVGPAVLGALIVTLVLGTAGRDEVAAAPWWILALVVAGLVAWWRRNAAAPMLAALVIMIVAEVVT